MVSFLAACALTSCAVMDKDDCLQSNWHELGQRDALKGSYRAEERRQACTEHGISMDKTAYDRGVVQGKLAFCTSTSGRAHGDAGHSYERGFCPVRAEDDFLQGYLPAIERYKYRQRIKELQQRIDNRHRDLNRELERKEVNRRTVEVIRSDIHRMEQQLRHEMMFTRPAP